MDAPRSFEEFWPYYVSQHRSRACRRLHFSGTLLGALCVVASPLEPRLLLLAPLCGYGFSWVGHLAFERNRPASWYSLRHFVWSFRGDMRMFARMLAGTLDRDLAETHDTP